MLKGITVAEFGKLGFGFALGLLTYNLIKSSNMFSLNKTKVAIDIKQSKKEQFDQIKEQQLQNKTQLNQLNNLEQLLVRKSLNFEIETIEGLDSQIQILTKQCLISFFRQTYDLLDNSQIVQITQDNRKARRQIIQHIDHNYETYFRFVCTLDENIKYLIEKAQKDFAKVMESIGYHIQTENLNQSNKFRLEVVQVMAANRQGLMNYLPLFNNPVTKSLLIKILKFQSTHLNQKKQQIALHIQKLGIESKEQEEVIPQFISCYMQDKINQNFGIQSEQINISSEQMTQQIEELFIEWKCVRQQVIKYLYEHLEEPVIIAD